MSGDNEDPPTLPIPEGKKDRFDLLRSLFKETYGEEPTFFARAPGRVNLIGEHIDYCGYSVLPMAIEQDIVMAVAPDRSGKISLINTKPQFQEFNGDVMNFTITKDIPHWYKYVLCGIQGVKEKFCSIVTQGMKVVVDGTIPQSAGLSSSSALVCCAALAMLKVNSWPMSKEQLAETCAVCERYIGTEGGGMDQAISLTAKSGKAKHIEFNPLRTADVQLPSDAAFVISNSLAEMNKAATPHFNIRVVECRLAAQIIAQSKPDIQWREIRRLGELQEKLGVSLDEMVAIVSDTLHEEPYSKTEVCKILGVTSEELGKTSLSDNTQNVETFYLRQRATHVYSEAKRVLSFKTVCESQPLDALAQLGKLMDESHASCRDLYQCSHPDLDRLVEVCKNSGAVGSRMTGAGWGGCAVSLVKADSVLPLLTSVRDGYYKQDDQKLSQVKQALFATTPGDGAAYYVSEP